MCQQCRAPKPLLLFYEPCGLPNDSVGSPVAWIVTIYDIIRCVPNLCGELVIPLHQRIDLHAISVLASYLWGKQQVYDYSVAWRWFAHYSCALTCLAAWYKDSTCQGIITYRKERLSPSRVTSRVALTANNRCLYLVLCWICGYLILAGLTGFTLWTSSSFPDPFMRQPANWVCSPRLVSFLQREQSWGT